MQFSKSLILVFTLTVVTGCGGAVRGCAHIFADTHVVSVAARKMHMPAAPVGHKIPTISLVPKTSLLREEPPIAVTQSDFDLTRPITLPSDMHPAHTESFLKKLLEKGGEEGAKHLGEEGIQDLVKHFQEHERKKDTKP